MSDLDRAATIRGLASVFVALAPLFALACATEHAPSDLAHVSQAATAPSLGTAEAFSVLAASTVTNTGETVVARDLGVSPGLAVTGFPPGIVNGTIHAGDAVALQAQLDVETAYDAAAAQPCTVDLTGQDLGGLTLTAGVYCFSTSAQLTGSLVLDAQGDPAAVFVFKIGSTLTTASGASVDMINGGQECGVFWQVGSSATLGTTTVFRGNILALASISLNTGASVAGRALARTGAVTLDTNDVSDATCATSSTTGAGSGATTTSAATGTGGAGATTGAGAAGGGAATSSGAGPGGTGATTGGTTTTSAAAGAGGAATTSAAAGTGGTATTSGAGGAGGGWTGAGGSDQGAGGSGGKTTCGTECVDLQTDANNCGACGHACAPLEICVAGSCAPCPP